MALACSSPASRRKAHVLPDGSTCTSANSSSSRARSRRGRALAARRGAVAASTPTEIDAAIALVRRIREQGATIVFVEHVMRAVMALTDRVVVLTTASCSPQGAPPR